MVLAARSVGVVHTGDGMKSEPGPDSIGIGPARPRTQFPYRRATILPLTELPGGGADLPAMNRLPSNERPGVPLSCRAEACVARPGGYPRQSTIPGQEAGLTAPAARESPGVLSFLKQIVVVLDRRGYAGTLFLLGCTGAPVSGGGHGPAAGATTVRPRQWRRCAPNCGNWCGHCGYRYDRWDHMGAVSVNN